MSDKLTRFAKEIDEYMRDDNKQVIKKVNDIIITNNNDPYQYHNKELINKIINLNDNFTENKLKCEKDVCCICLDNHKFDNYVFFKCNHYICINCFSQSEMRFGISNCPLCRKTIERCIYNDKYAIIALGTKTNVNMFLNGGYKNISFAYFPKYNGESNLIISDITYKDSDLNKERFVIHIEDLILSGYTIVIQDYNKMKRWFDDMMLKDHIFDIRFVRE